MFEGKVVIVTGGAAGIGRAAALRFAQEGGAVCVADLDLQGAERTAAEIEQAGGVAFGLKADVSCPDDNDRMVEETIDRFGGLDVAFLNAGYLGPYKPFFDHSLEEFDRAIAINLRGCYLGLRATGRAIRENGAIVVTSSTAGLLGFGVNAPYAASKHGALGLVKSAAEALAARKVRVNAICPGGINTAMTKAGGAPDLGVAADELPMPEFRGMGSAEHIAELALFLASRRAAYITGAVHVADGGLMSSFNV